MPAHIVWKDDHGKHSWYLADGYRVQSLKTKSKSEAKVLLKQYNEGKSNLKPCPSVREFYKEWIGRQGPPLYRRSRTRDHKQAFSGRILPRFRNTELKDLKTADLRAFQADLLKEGLSVKYS